MKLLTQWMVTSSALLIIVLVVRFFVRDKLSARMRYALWGIILLRLLFPFQFYGDHDVLPVVASNLASPLEERLDQEKQRLSMRYIAMIPSELVTWEAIQEGSYLMVPLPYDHAPLPDHISVNEDEVIYQTIRAGGHNMDNKLLALWRTGVAAAGAIIFLSNLLFAHRLKRRRNGLEGTGAPIPVYLAEGLASPCLFGVFQPAVYVTPEAAKNPDILRHVLAHELTHYAHKDHIWSLLRILALALHWYNPLVWLAVVLSKRDGELACDEGAVARLGEGERIPYGRTLVDMVACQSLRPSDLLSCSTAMSGGKKSIQQRISRLARKPETVKAAVFLAAAALVPAAVFAFAGRSQPLTAQEQFFQDVEQAVSIRFSPALYSSQFYPSPIQDPDLLDAAKKLLRSAVPLGPDDPEPERDTLMHSSTITLSRSSGEESFYTLLWEDGCTYVFAGAVRWWEEEPDGDPWHSQVFRTEQNLVSALESMARGQWYREREDLTPATYGYNMFWNQLDAAQGIWLAAPMLHDGRVLTNPEPLEQVKQLLVLTPIPRNGPLERDEDWTDRVVDTIAFSLTQPGPEWTGADAAGCYSIVYLDEDCFYVCSGDNQEGYYIGTISSENWENARQILQNAPTVDDRQRTAASEEDLRD